MSYSFKVIAQGGQLTVATDGHVPDGTFVINGHESTGLESTSVGVWLNGPDGAQRLYAYAAGQVPPPMPAPAPAPAAAETPAAPETPEGGE